MHCLHVLLRTKEHLVKHNAHRPHVDLSTAFKHHSAAASNTPSKAANHERHLAGDPGRIPAPAPLETFRGQIPICAGTLQQQSQGIASSERADEPPTTSTCKAN